MNLESLFSIAGTCALVGWLLLLFLPRWSWSTRLIGPVLIPGLLAIAYGVLVALHLAGAQGGFGSLEDVATLFETREILLAGWIHYLAFDLFVGSWEVRDARELGISHLLVVPCLVLTFLLGPVGLGLYFLLRASRRRLSIEQRAG